ncbi:hypothetical protein [Streptomyces canus]|uniref:hypothetical protein n=1 Tax=Streptomyces canus TaxID=58343 RepID=UPI00035E0A0E|nr:hypothetical protein [Streptomyces canus]
MSGGTLHVCRARDSLITDPEDGVIVAHELGNSGPGWDVWAHRDHADDVDLIDPDLLRIMTRIWAAKAAAT